MSEVLHRKCSVYYGVCSYLELKSVKVDSHEGKCAKHPSVSDLLDMSVEQYEKYSGKYVNRKVTETSFSCPWLVWLCLLFSILLRLQTFQWLVCRTFSEKEHRMRGEGMNRRSRVKHHTSIHKMYIIQET